MDSGIRLSPAWRVVGHTLLMLLALIVLAPLAVMLGAAFKPAAEIHGLVPWPVHPTLANFAVILEETPYLSYMANSAGSTFLRVAGQILIAVPAAYAFARFQFRGRNMAFLAVLAAMMVPQQLTMIPNYLLIARLGWFDSWAALVVPNLAMPFAVFLLRQHFLGFPRELFDAAAIDGAGPWRALWLIAVPNLKAPLAAVTIVLLIECWNEYFWPLLVARSPEARTLQVGLRAFLDEDFTNYGALMAGVTLASLPVLLLFFLLQRQVVQSFTSSGVKG